MRKIAKRPFLGLFPKNQPNEIFPEKSGSVTFDPLWTPNFIQKSEKIMSQLHGARTDNPYIIGPWRNLFRGSKNHIKWEMYLILGSGNSETIIL